MTWMLNESRALKKKLSGLFVHATSTSEAGQEVPVHFVEPDQELGDMDYPGIYIRYGPMAPASNRQLEGPILFRYAPEGYTGNVQVPVDMDDKDNSSTEAWMVPGSFGDPGASPYKAEDVPRAYDLHFDINVLVRNYQQALELTAKLARIEYLPQVFGFLEIPEDGTVRTLELLGGPEVTASRDADDKRGFQIVYSIRVASELSLYDIEQVNRVATVDVDFSGYDPAFPPQ